MLNSYVPILLDGKWNVYDKTARVFYAVTPNTRAHCILRCSVLNGGKL